MRNCPTKALYQRDDGIVDFDGGRCIGCKSCMQGCPYDAIYLHTDTGTIAGRSPPDHWTHLLEY